MSSHITYDGKEWWKALGPDGAYAMEEVYDTYGHRLKPKWKQLRKFGRKSIPAKDVSHTIMTQGSTAVLHETYTTANTINSVIASTTGQTQSIRVEGQTIDTSGDLQFVVQNVTLGGSTAVSLTTPLARCTRLAVNPGTFASPTSALSAAVYAYQSTKTGVSGGVPSSAVHVNCIISNGSNQSEKCATSVSYKDYWLIKQIQAAIPEVASPNGTAAFDIDLEIRSVKGGVFRPSGAELSIGAGSRFAALDFSPYIIVPPNSDVRLTAIGSTSNLTVTGAISGILLGVSSGDLS